MLMLYNAKAVINKQAALKKNSIQHFICKHSIHIFKLLLAWVAQGLNGRHCHFTSLKKHALDLHQHGLAWGAAVCRALHPLKFLDKQPKP